MSTDKSKNKKSADDSSEEIVESLSSKISDIFDADSDAVADDNDKTIVDEVKEKADDVVDDVVDTGKDIAAGAAVLASKAKDTAEDAVESVADVIEDAKDAISDVVEDTKDAISDAVDDAKDALDEVFGNDGQTPVVDDSEGGEEEVKGIAAFFNHPDHLMYAAEQARKANYEIYDAYSPFPIHGMDDAMGLERSWLPWVTFGAGATGFSAAFGLQFGIMGFDWPMVFGGRPFIAWPSFVPILFELTVLFAGVTTAIVMLFAAGCFRKPFIIDKDITNDQFVLWISADDEAFDIDDVIAFMKKLNPHTIRAIRESQT